MSKLTVSVIVPALNAADTLPATLSALEPQLGPGDEVVVVDDGSSDRTAEVAAAMGAVVVRFDTNQGVGAARNAGSEAATGDVLLFTDADATLKPDVVDKMRERLHGPDAPAALVGLYAPECVPTDVVSRFKNLWIRYTYLAAAPDIDFLFGCICALRRDLFLEIGGFDTQFHRNTGGVDIELGMRLREHGHAIRLDADLEAVHGRAFTLRELMRNDYRRASGYAALGVKRRGLGSLASKPKFANIPTSYLAGTALVGMSLGSGALVLSPLFPIGMLGVASTSTAHAALNAPLYRFLAKEGGLDVALAGPPLVVASQLAAGFGAVRGLVRMATGR